LLLAFFLGMCGLSVYGYLNGNPMLLLTTWDYDGNGCGFNTSTVNYPYLYFVAPDVSNLTAITTNPLKAFAYTACVSSCPTNTSTVNCYPPSFFNNNNIKF
jgi:hypothetical protein